MPDQVDWRAIEREATPGRAVGRLLRDQREARGLTVVDIEKRLRIRKNYVEALESGRFDQLPGAAYIPAFLRAYAIHLGLDSEKVLSAFQLAGPVPIKRPVALPADFPIVEKRAPIGLAVLTVMLVVGAGYGVWHYFPRQQAVVAEKVPPVPDRLLASAPPSKDASKPAPAPATMNAPAAVTVVTPAPSTPQPPTQASVPAAPSAAPPIVVTVPAPPPPVVLSSPSVGQAQAAQPAAEPTPAQVQQPQQEARSVQPEPAAVANPAAAVPPASLPVRIDTPVVMRANSWVELRAPNGDILAMTYVRAGETYTVPAGISYRVIDAR